MKRKLSVLCAALAVVVLLAMTLSACSAFSFLSDDHSKGNWLAYYESNRQNDKYLRVLEYLVSMLFIAKCCRGFVTCMTSGSTGVMCLSEGFDYLYVFDLGLYP